MFKGAKWRSEKNKIKAVFKVQFQATQVPQTGWDSLLVALVPSETGKPSSKTDKVQVHNGACIWGNPVYETIKLSREPKTGKFEGKKYQFIVSNGSSKGGILGQTAVDFAEYADAIEPCFASLSLGASNSTVLHITIQRLPADGNMRSAATRSADTERLRHQMSDVDTDGSSKTSYSTNSCASKDVLAGNGTVQFSPSIINTVPRIAEYDNKGFRSSDAISATSSDSSSGNDLNHEYKFKADIHKDTTSVLSPLNDHTRSPQLLPNGCNAAVDHKQCEDSDVGWSLRWTSKESKENSMNTSKEMNLNEKLQAAEIEVAKLKDEIAAMGRHAELSDVEVQTLRKQIIKENKKVQEFSKEICSLREERDALRQHFEQVKVSKATDSVMVEDKAQDNRNGDSILEEVKQELVYEQQLNSNLHLQLEKTQQANSDLILAVQDLELLLEQKEREISHVSSTAICSMPVTDESCQELSTTADALRRPKVHRYPDSENITHEGDQEQLELEVLIKEHDDSDKSFSLEQKILDLQNELDECKKDRDHIEMQMEQLALDYEILKQENHDMAFKLDQSEIQEQLKMQYEASMSLAVINDLEAHVENLERELAKQEEIFEAELAALTRAKVEQEQKAIRAEDILRKTRQSNADTAGRLQQEFKTLFTQMSSTFGANERLSVQAMTEANDLRIQKSHLVESLRKSAEELQLVKDRYEEELTELSSQLDSKTSGINQLLSEVEYLSTELKVQKKVAEVAINTLAGEILSLKADIQILIIGKNDLFKKVEEKEKILLDAQEMEIRMNEKVLILEKEDAKIKTLESEVLKGKSEAGKLLEDLHDMRLLLVEKEKMIGMLQSEKETMEMQYNELKQSLFERESEKQNPKKEFLRSDLRNNQDAGTAIEKKVIDNASSAITFEGNADASIGNNDSHSVQQCTIEAFWLQHKIQLLQEEVKIKERMIHVSRDEFTEKKRDLYARIEELQKAALSQSWNISNYSDRTVQEAQYEDCRVGDDSHHREETSIGRSFSETEVDILSGVVDHTDNEQRSSKSIVIDPSDEQKTCNPCIPSQDDITKLIAEISHLKKKNTSMEDELKEMQGRYSDLSLKFAEVEGERQQLIMSVRSLKNAKRT